MMDDTMMKDDNELLRMIVKRVGEGNGVVPRD